MNFRKAAASDLPRLKAVYEKIIADMYEKGIDIWDDIYPCEFFADDIAKGRLWLLESGSDIAAAFMLCDENDGESSIKWRHNAAKALYIDRLGVNTGYLRRGIGLTLLQKAAELALEDGADCLRLFVADVNTPAIKLYEKAGFERASGIYEEHFDDFVLREYGYEKRLR